MTYYFSDSLGDDSRTSVQAQSSATPWKTLTKLNAIFGSLIPGDSVLFKKGDTFYGSIVANKSGTSGSPISFGAYDSGANPIISGFFDVPGWTSLGSNLWQSTAAVSTLTTLNMVKVSGVFQPIGKWPTVGYNNIASHTGLDNQIGLSASLTSSTSLAFDPTGGQVVVRKRHWILDKATVTSRVGDTISFINPTIYAVTNNFGYFIQNHQSACDTSGEWWYDSASNKIGMYKTTSPTGVKVSNVEFLVNVGLQSFLIFSDIDFEGSNSATVNISSGHNITFGACDFSFSGVDVFAVQPAAHHLVLANCTANHTNNNFIFGGGSQNWMITGCDIQNTGQVAGMGSTGDGKYIGMYNIGANSLIQFNRLTNTGYNGIDFRGGNIQVMNNVVDTFCNVKDDGAGIYTYTGPTTTIYAQRTVDHNIVMNAGGADAGTNTSNWDAHGIYMDGNSSQVTISANTVFNCGGSGIFLNANHDITVINNTFYNNATRTANVYAQIYEVFPTVNFAAPVRNLTILGNKFVSRDSTQRVAFYKTNETDMSQWPVGLTNANYNSNFYCRPINEDATTFQIIKAAGTTNTDLPGWTSASGGSLDNASNISPLTIVSLADLRFEYNDTNAPISVSLGGDSYVDVANVGYSGSVSVPAYSSIVLIRTDSLPTPGTVTGLSIAFALCDPAPVEGYQILYRVTGDPDYIDGGFFFASPAVITGLSYPEGTLFDAIVRVPDCTCVPVSAPLDFDLPLAATGTAYDFTVDIPGTPTAPITVTRLDVPDWLDIEIVDNLDGTFSIHFTGDPEASVDPVNVNFTVDNDCSSIEIDKTLTVINLEALVYTITETAITGTEAVRYITLSSFDGSDQNVVVDWGDGVFETGVLPAFANLNLFHVYPAQNTSYTSICYFENNVALFIYSDAIPGPPYHRVTFWTKSINFTASQFANQLQGVDDVANVLPPNPSATVLEIGYGASPDSTMTTLNLSTIDVNIDFFSLNNYPVLASVTGVPSFINALLEINNCPLLASVQGVGGVLPAVQNIGLYNNAPGMTYDTINFSIMTQCSMYNIGASVAQVNAILIGLDGNGLTGGGVSIRQTPAAAPTGAGLTAKANLIAKGWSVDTD